MKNKKFKMKGVKTIIERIKKGEKIKEKDVVNYLIYKNNTSRVKAQGAIVDMSFEHPEIIRCTKDRESFLVLRSISEKEQKKEKETEILKSIIKKARMPCKIEWFINQINARGINRKDAKNFIENAKREGKIFELKTKDGRSFLMPELTFKREQISILAEILENLTENRKKNCMVEDFVKQAKEQGIDEKDAKNFIENAKREGKIFEPRDGEIGMIE